MTYLFKFIKNWNGLKHIVFNVLQILSQTHKYNVSRVLINNKFQKLKSVFVFLFANEI